MYRSTVRRYGAFGLLLLCAGLGSCGGREAHPVSATTPYDNQLTCDHLHAERKVNDQKIADLTGERQEEVATNVGMVLAGGIGGALMMDTSNAEATEIGALNARNKVLDALMPTRCAVAGTAAPVPAVASAAPAAHDASASTPSIATVAIAAAPGSAAKANAPAAAQAPVTVASTASAPPSTAATSPTSTADGSPQKPAPGTWVAKLHWIPTLLAPRFSGTGESMLAYDVALTNLSIDANKLNISSDKSNITGTVAGGTIALDGWYKDPWGNVNSVKGSLTENGGAFTGQETCYNTQLAASDPTSQTTPHYCKIELSQIR